jgi:hypothetical protein
MRIAAAGQSSLRIVRGMTPNPFSPPTARLSEPVTELRGKPAAVWILQIVGVPLVLVVANTLRQYVEYWAIREEDGYDAIDLGLRILVLVLFTAAIVVVQRRGRVGRYLGMACIGLLDVGLIYAVGMAVHEAATGKPADRLMDFAFLAASVALLAPMLFWLHAFAFSAASKAWFRVPRAS